MRAKGLKVPRNDLFVATVAMGTGLSLVCRDAHFTAINKALGNKMSIDQSKTS